MLSSLLFVLIACSAAHAFGRPGRGQFEHSHKHDVIFDIISEPGHETAIAVKQGHHPTADPIAVGTSTFTDLVKRGKMFIDNSLLIAELLQNLNLGSEIMIAPTKWGKSTNLQMVKTFLEIQIDQQGNQILPKESTATYRLFAKGEIAVKNGHVDKLQNPLLISQFPQIISNFQGHYPIVYLNLKDVVGENYTVIENKMRSAINRAFQRHHYMLTSMEHGLFTNQDIQKFKTYLHNSDQMEIGSSLHFLCKVLHEHFKKLVFVLVDDYDTPILSALKYPQFTENDAEQTFNLLLETMDIILRHDGSTQRSIVTGTYPLDSWGWDIGYPDQGAYAANESHPYQKYFGIKHSQVQQLLQQNRINKTVINLAHQWYGGFKSEKQFYHPASVASLLKHNDIDYFCEKHWSDSFISKIVDIRPEFRDSLLRLISKQPVPLREAIIIGKFDMFDLREESFTTNRRYSYYSGLFKFLQQSGYVTISDSQVILPNSETAYLMSQWMTAYYADHYRIRLSFIEYAAKALLYSIKNPRITTNLVEETLRVLYQQVAEANKFHKRFSKDVMIRSVFNCVVLWLQRMCKFQVDAYYNRIQKADVVLIDNEARCAVIVEVSYNERTVEDAYKSAEQFHYILQNFTDIRSVQFVGLYLSENNIVHLLSRCVPTDQMKFRQMANN